MFAIITKLSYGQTLKADAVVKANNLTYSTTSNSNNNLVINNVNNKLQNRKPKLSPTAINYFEKKDKTALLKVFNKVFTTTRIKELLPENGIFINFYVNPQGKVLEVNFSLHKNTLITPIELEQLETEIKRDVTFDLQPKETKGGDFFVFSEFIRYSRVLDGSLQ